MNQDREKDQILTLNAKILKFRKVARKERSSVGVYFPILVGVAFPIAQAHQSSTWPTPLLRFTYSKSKLMHQLPHCLLQLWMHVVATGVYVL